MDMNLLNSGLPQLNLTPFTQKQRLMSTEGQLVTIQFTPSVDIQQGFEANENIPLRLDLSMDQHTLRFYIEERYSASGTIQYALSLVGQIFYNIVLSGLVSIYSLKTGVEGPMFNRHGSYNVNFQIGVFDNLVDVKKIILNNFSIDSSLQEISVLGADGQKIVYNPDNPKPFISILNGESEVTLNTSYITIISDSIDES